MDIVSLKYDLRHFQSCCNMRSMGLASNTTTKLNHATVLKISYKNNMLLCLSHSYYTASNFISKNYIFGLGQKCSITFPKYGKMSGVVIALPLWLKAIRSAFYCRACKYTGPNERHVFLRSMLIIGLRICQSRFIIDKLLIPTICIRY